MVKGCLCLLSTGRKFAPISGRCSEQRGSALRHRGTTLVLRDEGHQGVEHVRHGAGSLSQR
jgi:hypothetical protein